MGMTAMIASTAMSVMGSIQQGKAAKAAANYNVAIANRNAGIARQQAAADAESQQRDARHKLGAMRAAYGASGITAEGSPIDVLESSAAMAELDKQNILYKGELRAMGYADEAALEKTRGNNAMNSAYMKAGSSLLTGFTKGF
jgi:hypothetical protein